MEDVEIVRKTPAAIFATGDGLNWKAGKPKGVVWSTAQVLPEEISHRYAGMLPPAYRCNAFCWTYTAVAYSEVSARYLWICWDWLC